MKNRKSQKHQSNGQTENGSLPQRNAGGFAVPEHYFSELPEQLKQLTLQEKGTPGFEVPAGYFENLPAKLNVLLLAGDAGKKNIFAVPASYFEELPGKISARVHAGEKRSTPLPRLILVPVAAAVALLIGVGIFFMQDDAIVPVQTASTFENIAADEALEYLSERSMDLNEDDLMEAVEEPADASEKHDGYNGDVPELNGNLDAAEIEEFLLEQKIDETMLLNHDL